MRANNRDGDGGGPTNVTRPFCREIAGRCSTSEHSSSSGASPKVLFITTTIGSGMRRTPGGTSATSSAGVLPESGGGLLKSSHITARCPIFSH
jgi:hypothetical protein